MSSEQKDGHMFTEQEEQEIQSEMMCNGPTWWHFDCNRREEPQYAAWKADSRWQRIYRFLRRGLWHVTSIEGWDGIQASGEVRPNTNNKYPMSYPQTKMSFGYNHGYTALFDFVTPGEEWTSPRMVDTQLRVYNHPGRSSNGSNATYLHP